MPKDQKASVDDDPETAQEKSGSVDERVPEPLGVPTTADAMMAGAAAYIPDLATGLPAGTPGDLGPGEAALEHERKAQRSGANIQRG